MNEEYFTEHPWSGDNGSHEDWEKVLTLKALALGGNIMYLWVRGEGPDITLFLSPPCRETPKNAIKTLLKKKEKRKKGGWVLF